MNAAELHSLAKSAGVAGVEEWGPATSPGVMQGAKPVYMTDGLASESPVIHTAARVSAPSSGGARFELNTVCDPNAIIPEPGCEGWVPEPETVPDTPPLLPFDPNILLVPIDSGLAPAPDGIPSLSAPVT